MKIQSVFFLLILAACSTGTGNNMTEKYKSEIVETEKAFAKMAAETGVADAFGFYADENAVISRGREIIKGKDAIKAFYEENLKPGTVLEWTPDFVDVSGDLGYTWGKYTHRLTDSTGVVTESHGVFHTVWKRQADGTWRFVWD